MSILSESTNIGESLLSNWHMHLFQAGSWYEVVGEQQLRERARYPGQSRTEISLVTRGLRESTKEINISDYL